MNLTVAWAPFGGWDPKTEQPGSFAQEAELSRTDSHVNLTRLRASQSLKDFQERLQQLGEGRAADAGEQPQWRADQRPLRTLSRGYRPGGGPAKVPGHRRCTGCILTPEALCPGGGGHGSELKAAPPQEALGPRLSQALSWPTTPPTLALQGSGRTKAGEGPGATTEGSPGPCGGTTRHMPRVPNTARFCKWQASNSCKDNRSLGAGGSRQRRELHSCSFPTTHHCCFSDFGLNPVFNSSDFFEGYLLCCK